MGRNKFKNQICIYCGAPASTVDHTPPRSLFPKANRGDLISVPCCATCNSGFSKDDEYWQWAFVTREEAVDHPDAAQIREGVHRAIAMPQKRGLVTTFWQAMQVEAANDNLQREGRTYTIPHERIERFFTRIIRALYYHETDKRLPEDYEVLVFPEQVILSGESKQTQALNTLRGMILKYEAKEIGNGVFSYRCATDIPFGVPGDHDSLWWMQLYGDVGVLSITQKRLGA